MASSVPGAQARRTLFPVDGSGSSRGVDKHSSDRVVNGDRIFEPFDLRLAPVPVGDHFAPFRSVQTLGGLTMTDIGQVRAMMEIAS